MKYLSDKVCYVRQIFFYQKNLLLEIYNFENLRKNSFVLCDFIGNSFHIIVESRGQIFIKCIN